MAASLVIGVTGGIAAFKTAALVSRLVQDGHAVSVAMTRAATKMVAPATFAALSGRRVATRVFDRAFPLGAHIELARGADLLCVAPASADFLAKAAVGLADDVVSTLYLAFDGPVIVAPAMNAAMWNKPAVQRNVERLREDGVELLMPQPGWLSCREEGPGRMVEPEAIRKAIEAALVPKERGGQPQQS
ncbi:MAG TPA: phosphopantothenoylcysteine decarboxylase [Planctomycetaceae bacterium]|nr:phosphopantothenoylcysteine decarboxylase [Planctomycetaceae bacterium]